MNICFLGAIRGGRGEQPSYLMVVEVLQRYGTVLSAHVADETISGFGETELSEEEIYAREVDRVRGSDVVIAEVTLPSLGVGYLVGQASLLHKKVICLYHGEHTDALSAMIKGDPAISVYTYDTMEDLEAICSSLSTESII